MIRVYESAISDQWEDSYNLDNIDGAIERYSINADLSTKIDLARVINDAIER